MTFAPAGLQVDATVTLDATGPRRWGVIRSNLHSNLQDNDAIQDLERIKRHLTTAEDLQSVVKTMKALAAVNLRQYERAVASLAEYNRTVDMGLHVVLPHHTVARPHPQTFREGRLGALVFGSDHGLCGRFNEQIVDYALDTLPTLTTDTEPWHIFAVGTRAAIVHLRLAEQYRLCGAAQSEPAPAGGGDPTAQRHGV